METFNPFNYTSPFDDSTNDKASDSPFGKKSLFYIPEFIEDDIDFQKIAEYLKKRKDFDYDYEKFIGHKNFILPLATTHQVISIPYDSEIPFIQKTVGGERALQLKGRLYKEKGIVNIDSDFNGDEIGGLEFDFDYKRRKVNYKRHRYFVGKQRVYEKDNTDNIAFTISSSSFEDFNAFLDIESPEFLNKIKTAFLNAIKEVNKSIAQKKSKQLNGNDARDLDWIYQNIPSFVAKELNFVDTISNVFKLNFADITSPVTDFTKPITAILQKLNSESVYNYFYKNPKKLIFLLKGFDDDNLVKQFCKYLTAVTFLYTKQNIEKSRNFAISDSTHTETNILYGDEEGKVELRNELQLPTFGLFGLNFINLFTEDVEINNPKKHNNQFHPLDIIYISQYDENNDEEEKHPSIALYAKYLGDKSEWSDVTDATLAVIDIIGIIISAGALNAGVRGAARLFAIIDISISTINLALLNPDLRNRLSKTEAGRWFVNHWGVISFCASMGTISYYLAKGIVKNHAQLKKQLTNEPELAKQIDELYEESKRVVGMAENISVSNLKMTVEEFNEGLIRLSKIKRSDALDYIDDALIYFNHIVLEGKIVQVSDRNCANVVQEVNGFLSTGKIKVAKPSNAQSYHILEEIYKTRFLTYNFSSLKKVIQEGEKGILLCERGYGKLSHVINVIKKDGKLMFIDGQAYTKNMNLLAEFNSFKYLKTK